MAFCFLLTTWTSIATVIFDIVYHLYFTDRLREHISPTTLSDVVHPLSGTRWILKHYTVALLVDLNADLKHYFSVRHSVARLELSTSASEVIRHAGAI